MTLEIWFDREQFLTHSSIESYHARMNMLLAQIEIK